MQHLQELLLPQQRQVLLKNRAGKNYVKVKHNGTYSTQYLHMSKILVRRGQRVNQGDVIGEWEALEALDLPHVCYRFLEKTVQVDALRLNLTGDARQR
jgi:hypothetical protein